MASRKYGFHLTAAQRSAVRRVSCARVHAPKESSVLLMLSMYFDKEYTAARLVARVDFKVRLYYVRTCMSYAK